MSESPAEMFARWHMYVAGAKADCWKTIIDVPNNRIGVKFDYGAIDWYYDIILRQPMFLREREIVDNSYIVRHYSPRTE